MEFIDLVISQLVSFYSPYCTVCGSSLKEKDFSLSEKTKNSRTLIFDCLCKVCSLASEISWNYLNSQPKTNGKIFLTIAEPLKEESILKEVEEILKQTH